MHSGSVMRVRGLSNGMVDGLWVDREMYGGCCKRILVGSVLLGGCLGWRPGGGGRVCLVSGELGCI